MSDGNKQFKGASIPSLGMKHRKPYIAQGIKHLKQKLKRFVGVRFNALASSPPTKKTNHYSHVVSYCYVEKFRCYILTVTNVTVRNRRNSKTRTVTRERNQHYKATIKFSNIDTCKKKNTVKKYPQVLRDKAHLCSKKLAQSPHASA